MLIKGLKRTSLIEYPGKISAVVFVGGCNFRCAYCYNPDLVMRPEELPTIEEDSVLSFLRDRIGLLDAVCLTGGEPTLQPDLADFLREVKSMGFATKLETNGSRPRALEALLGEGLLDLISMDLKAPLRLEGYARVTPNISPGDFEGVRESFELLRASDANAEFVTTAVPGLVGEAEIMEIARSIGRSKPYVIQQFKPGKCLDPSYSGLEPYPEEVLRGFAERAGAVARCSLRGLPQREAKAARRIG
jgi:pyruvate formate lyase activating enzyme